MLVPGHPQRLTQQPTPQIPGRTAHGSAQHEEQTRGSTVSTQTLTGPGTLDLRPANQLPPNTALR